MKRSPLPLSLNSSSKFRDTLGFRVRSLVFEKHNVSAKDVLGRDADLKKTIQEEEAEGAEYILDGPLRRVRPYFFTYLTYCKLRWRDRNLIDIFVNEFRDRDADFYRKTITEGQVSINKKPANADTIVRNGDLISHRCHRHEPPVLLQQIKIVFEDDDIMAIDKPLGIPVHPTGRYRYNTITKIFQHEMGITVHPCNRLDRLTLGLMFLGKTSRGAEKMVKQIRDREVKKEYLARVVGKFPCERDIVVDKPLRTFSPKLGLNRVDEADGKEARTVFNRVLYDPESNTSIVKCSPLTGRTHQIRVHLQYIGHPIANDPIYLSEWVWGPELGRNGTGDNEKVMERLDSVGKTRTAQSWMFKGGTGEKLALENCPSCGVEKYTDPGPNDLSLWLHAYKYEAADLLWLYKTDFPEWALEEPKKYMEMALDEAAKCGETQTQFNVGCVLVHDGSVLSTGYSRELPGNTHAEQNALQKYFDRTGEVDVPVGTEIYTTMEPCTVRLSGNLPCTDRILKTKISTCFVGVVEPDVFVKNNTSFGRLNEAGIEYIHVPGYEEEALRIAKIGHEKREESKEAEEAKEEEGKEEEGKEEEESKEEEAKEESK